MHVVPHKVHIPLYEYAHDMAELDFPAQLAALGFPTSISRAVLEQCQQQFVSVGTITTYFDCFSTILERITAQLELEQQPTIPIDPETIGDRTRWTGHRFPWPVFEMAEFEFGLGNESDHICFDSVIVIVNLPCVVSDRMRALQRVLSKHLFCQLAQPAKRVTIPMVDGDTGSCAKGCAFVEFTTVEEAKRAKIALNGFEWAPNFRELRVRMFREYDGFDRDTDGDDSLALDKGYFCHELQQRCEDLETAINTISSVLAHRHQDDEESLGDVSRRTV